MFVQSCPRAKIVPAEIRRQAVDVALLFSLCRSGLQHSIVHADVFAGRISFAICRGKLRGPERRRNLFKHLGRFWQVFAHCIGEGSRTPQKHPAIPEVISSGNELGSGFHVGLFCKAAHVQGFSLKQRTRLDIPVARFGAVWTYPKHDNIRARRRNLNSSIERFEVAFLVRNHVVGRKQSEHCIRILTQQQERRQSNGRCSVAANRLGQNLPLRQLRQLLQNRRPQIFVCNDPEVLGLRQWQQPRHRLLDHRLLAIQREQLFGALFSA